MRSRIALLALIVASCGDDPTDPVDRPDAGNSINKCTTACTASDQCHVAGTCDPQTGLCDNPIAANGTNCDDQDACTQSDSCQMGACTGSNPVVCTASDQCHDPGACDPTSGACSNPQKQNGASCNDADACTQQDTCENGSCLGSNPVVCVASDQCHDPGTCNPATGACSSPEKQDDSPCDDINACTRIDTCQMGICVGSSSVTCTALDQCHDPGTCAPSTGVCDNPPKQDGVTCDDSNLCTLLDSCQMGNCVASSSITCAAMDQCHDPGTCNPTTGVCSNPPKPDGEACNDQDVCTEPDRCSNAVCMGSACSACTNLASQQTTYVTTTRAVFFSDNPGATVIDFETRANGAAPVAGQTFNADEFQASGVRVRLETTDPTAMLIWAGNPVGGFGIRLTCSNSTACNGDIVVELSPATRAAGFDYPGNVRGVWSRPNDSVIYDSGNVPGSGNNFLGLTSVAPIATVRLIRLNFNQISSLAFADCTSTCGPGGELCF